MKKVGYRLKKRINYYPFGLQHKGYNNTITGREHQYKYNGTELTEDLGYNMYEMPLRAYDPAIARWNRIDPVVHHGLSPYNAFDNNPVFYADPSGADSWSGGVASGRGYDSGGNHYGGRDFWAGVQSYSGITTNITVDWNSIPIDGSIVISSDNNSGFTYDTKYYKNLIVGDLYTDFGGPNDFIRINTKTGRAEIFADDNDYDTIETDGVISYSPKGRTESRLLSEGFLVRHTEGVGMGAFDNAVLLLSGEALFAWIGRGITATWGAWTGRTTITTAVGAAPKGFSKALGKWPWKKTTASIAELTAGGGNCLACAHKIQQAIGGRIINIVDRYGARQIGAMYNKAGKLISRDFKIHHAVRKGDMIFDRVTGPNGLHVKEYQKLFEYGKYLNFN